jgi:hypothetical protein
MSDDLLPRARSICRTILSEAGERQFRGFDPYDGLNSTYFDKSPFSRSRLCRLAWTQFNKRLPINLRQICAIQDHANPKGLALFLSGSLDLQENGVVDEVCLSLGRDLERASRSGFSGACWGYPFPWQGRSFYLPKHTPTIVVTAYAANALIDLFEASGEDRWLELARSACDFVLGDLNIDEGSDGICFSYSPIDTTRVHNASLLGAALLARVGKTTGEQLLLDRGQEAARFAASHQKADGSWVYGNDDNQQWVDHFHTGFVLDTLSVCADALDDRELLDRVNRGYRFYRDRMFTEEGAPKYFPDRRYPLDAHSYAQAILTLLRHGDRTSAHRVAALAIRDLWIPGRNFSYQQTRWYRNRVPYLRWSQAWMFRSLAALIRNSRTSSQTLSGSVS